LQLELAKENTLARQEKMIKEGRLMAGATKSDKEQEGMIIIGKKGNKKSKAKKVVQASE